MMAGELEELDLSGLAESDHELPGDGDGDHLTEDELQEHAKDALWLSGEMAPPEDIAYSLHRLDAAAGESLELLERIATAQERIATALEKALEAFNPGPSINLKM